MIGYHKASFNCAHWAIQEINRLHGAGIRFEDGDAWQASFIPFLRRFFAPSSIPASGQLVVMTEYSGKLHLGVMNGMQVKHNCSVGSTGSVIISDIGTIRSTFKKVRFYDPVG